MQIMLVEQEKVFEKKRHSQIMNILKKSVEVTIIKQQILELKISLIVSKLLLFAPAIAKQLKKAIFKYKAIQFCINTMNLIKVLMAYTPYSWYFMGLFKAKICLKKRFKVMIILDTNAKIKILSKKLMEYSNLTIRQRSNLKMISNISYRRRFLSLYENSKIAIKKLILRYPNFMLEIKGYNLVLS